MKKKRLFFLSLTILWVSLIFGFSLQTGEVSGDLSGSVLEAFLRLFMPGVLENPKQLELFHLIIRKCAHFTEFMILGVLSRMSLQYMSVSYKTVIGTSFCVLVATLDEILQLFVNGRAGRMLDVLIDGFGAIVGILLVYFIVSRVRRYK